MQQTRTIDTTIRDRSERVSHDLRLPGDVPISQLLPQLIKTLGQPAQDSGGRLYPYALMLRDSRAILPNDQSLLSLGISSGRILLLVVPTQDEWRSSSRVSSPGAAGPASGAGVPQAGANGSAQAGITFNRPPRIRVHLPSEEIELPAPPKPPENQRRLDPFTLLVPLATFGILVVLFLYVLPKLGQTANPVFLFTLGVFAVINPLSGVFSVLYERRGQRKEWEAQQEDYRGVLRKHRTRLEALRIEQHRARRASSPSVSKLKELIDERVHLWERRPDDDDFMHLRMGKTTLPSTIKVSAPSAQNNTDLQNEAEQLAQEFASVGDVPITLPVPQLGSVGVTGQRAPVVDFARALLCHLAIHHSPDEVRIAAIYPKQMDREWEWLKWLPHTSHFKAGNQNKMLAFNDEQIKALLNDITEEVSHREARQEEEKDGEEKAEPALPFVVLLIDDYNRVRDNVGLSRVLRGGKEFNLAAIVLVDSRQDIPGDCGAILEVPSYEQLVYSVAGPAGQVKSDITPDRIDWGTSDLLARSLAPIQVRGSQGPGNISTSVRLVDLLKLEAADRLDPLAWWNRTGGPAYGRLNVPIGEKSGGVLYLNLHNKEHGPHGLVAGTTGSGKSVLLQSLVAALAITHHPHLMNFVLVDFKGGSAFKDFEGIPHTVGMVSDLHGRLAERALIALKSELKRREQVLHEANVTDIDQYQELRARDPKRNLAPLPSLLIVIDEFAELAKELPNFMGGLISVVQKGRSLGVHLILATQRPAGVVSANIAANVKFRISLRVASTDDSREMLGRADAALLPHNLPGRGFFQVGAEIFEQFQAASVASPFRPAQPREARQQVQVAELTRAGHVHEIGKSRRAPDSRAITDERSELQVLMGLMEPYAEQFGSALFRPWPEPLPDSLPLPTLFQQVGKAALDGTRWEARPAFGWLNAPIGMLDLPADQKQEVFMLDLLRQGGHLLIAGSAGSGKSFLLRTIVTALALSHAPTDLNLYLIDFGGQMLRAFEKMPHVGGVFNSADSERIRRLFRKLKGIIEERKQLFRELRVDSFIAYHNRPGNNNQPPPPLPAIVVVIDKFAEFRAIHEQDFPDLVSFSRDGRTYGVHLIISTDRPGVVPSNLAGNLEMRYALRLADPADSTYQLGKGDAATLDPATPGRGLRRLRGLDEFQTALPVVGDSDEEQGKQLEVLSARMAQAARGVRADPIQLLPEYISLPDLITQASANPQPAKVEGLRVPLGIDDLTLRPVWGELHPDSQHFLIAGGAGTGKTALLRTWILGLAQRYTPADVQIYVVDFRRALRALSRLPHVKGFGDNELRLNEMLEGLKKELLERQQRLSSGSSSKTPPLVPIVLVIDDYELTSALPKNPGSELKDVARQARDIGLHAIIAGGINDLGRGFDGLVQQARAGRSGIVLGGDPQDNAILGVRILDLPPGRGYFVQRNSRNLMQAAFLEPEAVPVWMAQIRGSGVSIKG